MTCKVCATKFDTPNRGTVTVAYCSDVCRRKWASQRSIATYTARAALLRYICKHCGKTFVPKKSDRNQFCGTRCRNVSRADLSKPTRRRPFCKVYFLKCGGCGKMFATGTKEQKACRAICLVAMKYNARTFKAKSCPVCSHEHSTRWSRLCSEKCKDRAHRINMKKSKRKRRALGLDDHGKAYKRAKRCGVAYEVIRRRRVYERDGWMCLLCRKPIKQGVIVPHPLSATLDHIIPMSKGGPHTYANVQTAHFRCNWMKRDNAQDEQLLLVG